MEYRIRLNHSYTLSVSPFSLFLSSSPSSPFILSPQHTELQKSIKDIKEAAKNAMKTGKSLESKMKKGKHTNFDDTLKLHVTKLGIRVVY